MDSSSLAHCKWECQYHDDVRDIIKTLCSYKKVEIIAGAVCADHVDFCVSIPPKLSISDFVGYLKGKSALMIFDKHPEMGSKWDRSFCARGYYVTTVGNVNEEAVKEYNRRQTEESMNEEKKSYRPHYAEKARTACNTRL